MKYFFTLIISIFSLSFINAQTNHNHRGPTHSLRSDTIDVLSFDIHLFVPTYTGNITGYTAVTFSPKMNSIDNISLDLLKMTIDSIKIGNTILTYTYDDTLLISNFISPLNDNDTATIYVYYHGIPQDDPSTYGGWYFSGGYAYNIGVGFESYPHNFGRVWHPCFDNFEEHATYDFYITSTPSNKAYCNGYLVADTLDGNGNRVRHWRIDEPIVSYLASVAVSNFQEVHQQYISPISGDTIPIIFIAVASDTTNMKNSFVNLFSAIETFEARFGVHFWNKIGYVAVPFTAGAMEHVTNIAYPKMLIDGTTGDEGTMAHELSHHWWGDLVTCKSAEHMWINEGMANYSEKLFFENLYGITRYKSAIRSNHKATVWQHHAIDGGFFALSGVPQNVTYGKTTYDKGCDVAHTLRGYLGDSLFFLGLQTIIANNELKNIDSDDFRDQLNLINGIDVTDFFADWVNSPGYPHFSVKSFESVPAGGDFEVTVHVEQRLRGRTNYSNNVPLTVTFRDDNWNVHTATILSSGQNSNTTFTVPFSPNYVAINEDEKISDATTSTQMVIKTVASQNLTNSNLLLIVNSVTDSSFIRVDHNWVAPYQGVDDPTLVVSTDRYWKIHGTQLSTINLSANFTFNGLPNFHLDSGLMVDHGAVLFNEDSILLLYRANSTDSWSEFPTYTLNTQGSDVNKTGLLQATNIQAGEYTFGMRVYGVGINENSKTEIKLYPNPNDGNFKIDMGNSAKGEYIFSLYNSAGILVAEKKSSDKDVTFSPGELATGMYYLSVINKKKLVANLPVSIMK